MLFDERLWHDVNRIGATSLVFHCFVIWARWVHLPILEETMYLIHVSSAHWRSTRMSEKCARCDDDDVLENKNAEADSDTTPFRF